MKRLHKHLEHCLELIVRKGCCMYMECDWCPGSPENNPSGLPCNHSGWSSPAESFAEEDPQVVKSAKQWLADYEAGKIGKSERMEREVTASTRTIVQQGGDCSGVNCNMCAFSAVNHQSLMSCTQSGCADPGVSVADKDPVLLDSAIKWLEERGLTYE